jgi:DNA (cytosine-5)-methyltransferase 1
MLLHLERRQPILSLFSGAGGLDVGFEQAGFDARLAIDNWTPAVRTYCRNHPHARVEQLDLAKVAPRYLTRLWDRSAGTEPPVGIVGGPPCQAFSVSNVHKTRGDPRERLVDKYAAFIKAFSRTKSLAFFVFENVPGLLSPRHLRRYENFKRVCRSAGFTVYEKVLDAARFGVPQYRRRVIVVGIHGDWSNGHFEIPEGDEHIIPSGAVLNGLPEPTFYQRGLRAADIPFHPNHVTQRVKSSKFSTKGALEPGTKLGRSFRVLKLTEPSWTVAYGHREVHIHPGCHRRLSVLEAMLLQSFPPEYVLEGTLSQQITLVSDAVPPPVGYALGRALLSYLAKGISGSRDQLSPASAATVPV